MKVESGAVLYRPLSDTAIEEQRDGTQFHITHEVVRLDSGVVVALAGRKRWWSGQDGGPFTVLPLSQKKKSA